MGEAVALAHDTLDRVRSALAGYPADEVERAEREAIEAEGELPGVARDGPVVREMRDQHPRARAREAPDPEVAQHLASLSPTVTGAFTSRPDGAVEIRHRQPDGSWSEPTILPPPGAAGRAA